MIHPTFDAYTVEVESLITYDASAIAGFHFYGFEWIDNLHFLLPPSLILADENRRVAIEQAVMARFREEGWDGHGRLSLLWLPPFIFPLALRVAPEGIVVWHVKQTEDGISWLLSPIALPFEEFFGRTKQ